MIGQVLARLRRPVTLEEAERVLGDWASRGFAPAHDLATRSFRLLRLPAAEPNTEAAACAS